MSNGGVDSEDDYAYWGYGLMCQTRKEADRHVVTIDGYEDVPPNDGDSLHKALAHQPVAVAICASMSMQVGACGAGARGAGGSGGQGAGGSVGSGRGGAPALASPRAPARPR